MHDAPGDLVHVDIKKLGRIPDGGGWRVLGRARATGRKNAKPRRRATATSTTPSTTTPGSAYTEILPDERKETAAAFWTRANAFFAADGITVKRVLTDNGSCYRSTLFADALGSTSHTSAPGPTGPRPTARSNGSTAPCSRNGPTPAPTPPRPNASPPSRAGSTPTITTAATPHSRASHQPAACPTSPGQNT